MSTEHCAKVGDRVATAGRKNFSHLGTVSGLFLAVGCTNFEVGSVGVYVFQCQSTDLGLKSVLSGCQKYSERDFRVYDELRAGGRAVLSSLSTGGVLGLAAA